MDSLPCLNSKIFYFWNKQQIQNWGVEQFPGKQNERESFSLSKIEKYNRYKDKIIFSLEFNVWKLRRWIEFRSEILIFVLHVEIYTPINIFAILKTSARGYTNHAAYNFLAPILSQLKRKIRNLTR